jgi:quinoprotein glucose dehydrogenase
LKVSGKIDSFHLMKYFPTLFFLLAALGACQTNKDQDYSGWAVKGGTPDGLQYSSLDQINRENVHQLQVAWTYTTGDADTVNNRTQIQCNPIIVDGVLYATSATLKAFALDAATGKNRWTFSPPDKNGSLGVNRGLTYWSDGDDQRILHSFGENLYCLEAKSGAPITSFGDHGKVSLKEGLGERAKNLMVISNTPGVIYKDLIIMGSRVDEGPSAAPGYIRAFDVRTGKLKWVFHTIPQPGEPGNETWPKDAWQKIGGVNVWSGMTVDRNRGLVFAGTGSASFDFYGGNRKGKNLFANCVIALDAQSGRLRWYYQIVHHDLWDRDLPTAPILIRIKHEGKDTDAVAQVTKSGFVYIFDRDTGNPLFPIEEIPAPPSDLDGEEANPTQPVPLKPPPFARQVFTESMINKLTPEIEKEISARFKGLRTGRSFIPPSKEGTIIFPGFDGGAEWGGPSFDPVTRTLYVNANEMPWILTMIDVRRSEKKWSGMAMYRANCAACHGLDRAGDGRAYPDIRDVGKKYTEKQLSQILLHGKGVMPSFGHLSDLQRQTIIHYILNLENPAAEKNEVPEKHDDIFYSNTGYFRFLTKEGYPAVEPPWGTLTSIDLNEGKINWQVPVGEFKELKAKGIPVTGTENYGGSVTTAGGLVFLAATRDEKIRAFDKDTGKTLWEYSLPAGGYATPTVFRMNNKEFLVIACGGGKMGTRSGDSYIAFALP